MLLRVLVALLEEDGLGRVEVVEQILRRVAERAEEHGGVHLPAAVDADVDDVLGVELEVEPRAAVGDDARASRAACRSSASCPCRGRRRRRGSGGAG